MTKRSKSDSLRMTSTERVFTSLVAGAAAGALAKTTIAPLDRTKIYFQSTNARSFDFESMVKYLVESYKKDGFFSLWRGNSASMARVIPYAAIQYSAHEQFKYLLEVQTNDQKRKNPHRSFIAGSLAGLTSTAATYPLDVARARMAVNQFTRLSDAFIISYRQEGLRSLYRGFIPTIFGVIPYSGCSFFTYETLKRVYADYFDDGEPHAIVRLAFGACAGLIGQSGSYPLDIVRRRMQTHAFYAELGVIGTLKKVVIEEGVIHGLYKGLSMNWIKGPIAVGVSFTSYDMIHKLILSLYMAECNLIQFGRGA